MKLIESVFWGCVVHLHWAVVIAIAIGMVWVVVHLVRHRERSTCALWSGAGRWSRGAIAAIAEGDALARSSSVP